MPPSVKGCSENSSPRAHDFFLPGLGVRRGPDSYSLCGATVHADFPTEFELAARTNPWSDLGRQREIFLASDAAEFYQVNFWRPVLPMQGRSGQTRSASPTRGLSGART